MHSITGHGATHGFETNAHAPISSLAVVFEDDPVILYQTNIRKRLVHK